MSHTGQKLEKSPKWIMIFYLLGILFAWLNYTEERDNSGPLPPLSLFPLFTFLLFLLGVFLALGSLWFWRWSTAKALILMLTVNLSLAFFAAVTGRLQWNSELKRNLAYAETFVPLIETYQHTHGRYPAEWNDLGLSSAPLVHRHTTPITIGYVPLTNSTYLLSLPYGWYHYHWNSTNRLWEMYD